MKTYLLPFALWVSAASILVVSDIFAQTRQSPQTRNREYRIGIGDELSITFWQNPQYNTVTRVSATGKIEIPLIGSIQAQGLTTQELRQRIISKISLFDMNITQVAVTVTRYGSKTVYVTGNVLTPGKYTFEQIPNLWQIISEAGGPLPNANLSEVVIVRGSSSSNKNLIHVDLTKALERGDFSSLPPIYPGDTIHIQGIVGAPTALSSSPLERRSIVLVFGEVATPGVFNLEENMDILDAIVSAGGPTPAANLEEVRLYFRGERHAEVAVVNLKSYLKKSIPVPLELHPGDAVYVPSKRTVSPFVTEIIRIALSALASYLIFSGVRSF